MPKRKFIAIVQRKQVFQRAGHVPSSLETEKELTIEDGKVRLDGSVVAVDGDLDEYVSGSGEQVLLRKMIGAGRYIKYELLSLREI